MKPDQLRRLSDAAYAKAAEAIEAGDAAKARQLAELAVELAAKADLHPSRQKGTVADVEAIAMSRGAAISAAKSSGKWPFQQHLKARGLSIPEWCAQQTEDVSPNTAKSWVKKGKGARPVPRAWTKRMAAQFNDQRLLLEESWPAGIR